MNEKGVGDKEIKGRIVKGNQRYAALRPLLKSKLLSGNIKVRI